MKTNEEKSKIATSEEHILSFWSEHNIFKKSLEKEAPHGDFTFYDGPPFATGLPHYGHLLTGTVKDLIPRYKTMQGYHVARTWGWDCHGLPIENLIEKDLKLENKRDIEEYGIDKFNEAARNSVLRYEKEWKRYVPRSGRWVDMDNPYMSMHPSYMESVWWIFSELHKKGLTKQGFKAMHICPRCETTLANFEVNQGYEDVKDISTTVQFELTDTPGTYLLAWTTTPWTLPGNVALAVNPDISYLKLEVQGHDGVYILAEDLVDTVLEGARYNILESVPGKELVGLSYKPLFDYYHNDQGLQDREQGWKVYPAPFVTTEDGTGIVHLAPAFGSDDLELGQQEHLPFVQHVGMNGAFLHSFAETTEGKSFRGMKVKKKDDHTSTDIEIIKYLAHQGTLFSKKKFTHSYPHCWRCGTPLLNYATSSWFVDVPSIKEELLKINGEVNWVPDHIGTGRFEKWLEGVRDWPLSRARYWGTPLPVWQSKDSSETFIAGSIEDLLEKTKHSGNTYLAMRHGESQSNVTGEINADISTDNGLTETGRRQVLEVAAELKDQNIDLIIASPFQRAQETVLLIQQELKLNDDRIITDDRLQERNPGKEWEGKPWNDAHAQEETQGNDLWSYRLADDAESIEDIYCRSMEVMFDLEKKYQGKNILIVSHGGVLKTIQFGLAHYGDRRKVHDFYYTTGLPLNAHTLQFNFKPFPHREGYVLDLHRPYLENVVIFGKSGEQLELLGDVFDVWFDSGSMPYAQVHYPFEFDDSFEEQRFPAQFIAEGIDQTRGWFYVLMVLGVALFKKSPFENVVVTGMVLAEDGKKMSKSLKNYPDPYHLFDTVGADALRLYLISSPVVRGEELAFSEKGVREVGSKVMGRMRNIMSLYTTYRGDIDHEANSTSPHVLDRWILARTRDTLTRVQNNLDSYRFDRASRDLFDFVDDFSTWYVRRSRDRYKGSFGEEDQRQALATTRMVLTLSSQFMAPFIPFMAEELWQELRKDDTTLEESIHLSAWPEMDEGKDDEQLLTTMQETRNLVSEGLQLRSEAGVKVRQALPSFSAPLKDIPLEYQSLIQEEMNVKELIDGELALDTKLTPTLIAEGRVRELIRHIQSQRKKEGLEPHDRINLKVKTDTRGRELVNTFLTEIQETVGINEVNFVDDLEGETLTYDEISLTLSIER